MQRLAIDRITPGMVLDQDIYRQNNDIIPMLRKGNTISADYLAKLKEHGVQVIYVKEGSRLAGAGKGAAKAVYANTYIPKPKPPISSGLRNEAVDTLHDLFQSFGEGVHSSAQIIGHVDNVVEQLVTSLGSDRGTLININDLKSYDEYTYHHSLSVAVLSIAIGQYLHLSGDELNHLGKTAMMHDIGKQAIPLEIINKPSRLTDDEFTIIKNHTTAGYDYLVRQSVGDDKLKDGVVSHHEKMDGTGYPSRRSGEDISLWSRIISVADVYDALTSTRPYRTPMQPAEALEYVMGGIGTSFDYDVVSAFVQKVDLYPVGSFIELSNGKIAVVLNTKNNMRPVVRVIDTGETADLYYDRSYLSVVINRVITDDEVAARNLRK